MKKILIMGAIVFGIFYICLLSYAAVFYQEPMGEPAWIEWERENGYLRDAEWELINRK